MTKGKSRRPSTRSQEEASNAARLFENERISFVDDAVKTKATDEQLNSHYAKGDIRIVTETARYPLAGILSMLKETVHEGDSGGKVVPRYELDPQYQRRHRWNVKRQSRLIESFLMNVPVPPVFLYERDLARFEVMDGRQRLTALSEFYENKFRLEGLQYWADLDGRTYSELPSKIRDGIDRRYISSIILLKETAQDEEKAAMLKKLVFERLNSGGVELSPQETRNAVYNGPLNQLCLSLSENESFRRMWGIPLNPTAGEKEEEDDATDLIDESTKFGKEMFEKMADVELVLRFFAYRQIELFRSGLNKIRESLDHFLNRGNQQFPPALLARYREMFESTVSFLWAALGSEAYCIVGSSRRPTRPTKIVYDPIMYVASSEAVTKAREGLITRKEVLKEGLIAMYEAHPGLFSGRQTNFPAMKERNARVREAFSAAIARLGRS